MIISDQSGLTIEESFIGDFRETDQSNTIISLEDEWNPVMYVASGNIYNIVPRQGKFDAVTDGWDTVSGSGTEIPSFIIGDIPAPIYYLTGQQVGLVLDNVHNSTVNIEGYQLGRALNVKNCSNLEIKFKTRLCGRGLKLHNCTDIRVHDCDSSYLSWSPITSGECDSLLIENNQLTKGGMGTSSGGIFCQKTTNSLIRNNEISFIEYGHYYVLDGAGIYLEHYSSDNTVTDNTVMGGHMALQDNSGSYNVWEKNKLVDCDYAMDITDALQVKAGAPDYSGNILVDTVDAGPRTQPSNRQVQIQ